MSAWRKLQGASVVASFALMLADDVHPSMWWVWLAVASIAVGLVAMNVADRNEP